VGSALVNCIREHLGQVDKTTGRLREVAAELVAGTSRSG